MYLIMFGEEIEKTYIDEEKVVVLHLYYQSVHSNLVSHHVQHHLMETERFTKIQNMYL